MPKPTFEFIASPNRTPRTRPISAVVIHYTGSIGIEGTIAWFRNPVSKVSAHYVIGRDGRLVQMVKEDEIAWHAGRSSMKPHLPDGDPQKEPNVNAFSVGIELVGTADSGFTDRQMAALYQLLEQLVARYKVSPDRVVGHAHIAPGRKIDPDGYHEQFNWQRCREVCAVAFRALSQPKTYPVVN